LDVQECLKMAKPDGDVAGVNVDSPLMERRREARFQISLSVRIWGIDVRGERFAQEAVATNISNGGALLSLEGEPRCGDLVGIAHQGRQSRFRVVWVRNSGDARKIQVAVQKLEGDECPWKAALLQAAVNQD
jgi:hypothetical protein